MTNMYVITSYCVQWKQKKLRPLHHTFIKTRESRDFGVHCASKGCQLMAAELLPDFFTFDGFH